jgi:hypothetical protein
MTVRDLLYSAMVRTARVAGQNNSIGYPKEVSGVHAKTHRKRPLGPGLKEPREHERSSYNYRQQSS